MGIIPEVSESERGNIAQAQEDKYTPPHQAYSVKDADGLGPLIGCVFRVEGGTLDDKLARCSAMLDRCGIRKQDAIFVRLFHWLVRGIEHPEKSPLVIA